MQPSALETDRSAATSMTCFPRKANPLVTGLIIGLGFAVCGAQATPPAVDNDNSTSANNTNQVTISHATAGPNRLMLVGISWDVDGNLDVTSVTYNGVGLVLVGAH